MCGTSLLIVSAQCIMINLPHFSPLHAGSFVRTFYEYKDQSLVEQMYMTFFHLPVELSTFLNHYF